MTGLIISWAIDAFDTHIALALSKPGLSTDLSCLGLVILFAAYDKRYEHNRLRYFGGFMPYCQNCGTKNAEGVEFCTNCQQPLYDTRRRHTRRDGCYGEERPEHECFGLPHGGIIVGILFGLLLLIVGVGLILQNVLGIAINVNGQLIGPVVLIFIAILIIAGAIYQLRNRK